MLHQREGMLARIEATLIAAALGGSSLLTTGCDSEPEPWQSTPTPCTAGGPGTVDPEPCDPDPLRTNLPPLWNGLSVDIDDCPILEFTVTYNEPDAMIFKAMIKVESNFTYDAIGCTDNGPCCPEVGWQAHECACLGVMQNGPACGETEGLGLKDNGHPNMERDPNCAEFNNSVFNPVVNIEIGISRVARNRERMMENFPGCTEDQYTMMAVGEYHSYQSAQSCTVFNFDYDRAVVETYNEYAAAAGWPAHPYVVP